MDAKAHDRTANECVSTFAVCSGNHNQLVLRGSDDRSAPRSSLTLLERGFEFLIAIFKCNGDQADNFKFGNRQAVIELKKLL